VHFIYISLTSLLDYCIQGAIGDGGDSSPVLNIFRALCSFSVYLVAFRSFLKVVMYILMLPSYMQSVWILFSTLTLLAMSMKVSLKVLANSSQSSSSFQAYLWVSFQSMASYCSSA